jgi:hypothetical protein
MSDKNNIYMVIILLSAAGYLGMYFKTDNIHFLIISSVFQAASFVCCTMHNIKKGK